MLCTLETCSIGFLPIVFVITINFMSDNQTYTVPLKALDTLGNYSKQLLA